MVGVEPIDPLQLPGAQPLLPRGHRRIPVTVPAAQHHLTPGLSQPLQTVLADGVQQAVAGYPAAGAAKQHRLRHQAINQVSDRIRGDTVTGAHLLRRIQVK